MRFKQAKLNVKNNLFLQLCALKCTNRIALVYVYGISLQFTLMHATSMPEQNKTSRFTRHFEFCDILTMDNVTSD